MSLPQPDLGVLRKAQRGDERAFSIILRTYEQPVYNYVLRLTGDRSLSEDLTQEVFLRVYQGLPGFSLRSKFTTWLFQVTKNRVLDELRAMVPCQIREIVRLEPLIERLIVESDTFDGFLDTYRGAIADLDLGHEAERSAALSGVDRDLVVGAVPDRHRSDRHRRRLRHAGRVQDTRLGPHRRLHQPGNLGPVVRHDQIPQILADRPVQPLPSLPKIVPPGGGHVGAQAAFDLLERGGQPNHALRHAEAALE